MPQKAMFEFVRAGNDGSGIENDEIKQIQPSMAHHVNWDSLLDNAARLGRAENNIRDLRGP